MPSSQDTNWVSVDSLIVEDVETSSDVSQDTGDELVKKWGGLVKFKKEDDETVFGASEDTEDTEGFINIDDLIQTSEDVEVSDDFVNIDDLIQEKKGVYTNVKDYGKVDRDNLIQDWRNKYGFGKGGFHFERDRRGIQIDAPNGAKMIVPYASTTFGFEDTEQYWGKGIEMKFALRGVKDEATVEDLQNEVAEFINNNQDPEVDETQKKVGKEIETIFEDSEAGILAVIQDLANDNPNIAYSGDVPTPINTLTKSDLWGEDIYSEVLKRIVDKYGEGKGEEPFTLAGMQFGADALEKSGLPEYFQEEIFNKVVENLKFKETQAMVKWRKGKWDAMDEDQKEEFIEFHHGQLKAELTPKEQEVAGMWGKVTQAQKELDELTPGSDEYIAKENELNVFQNNALLGLENLQKGDPFSPLYSFGPNGARRVDRNFLEDQELSDDDIEDIIASMANGTIEDKTYQGKDGDISFKDRSAEIDIIRQQIYDSLDNKEQASVIRNYHDYLLEYSHFENLMNDTKFDLVKTEQYDSHWSEIEKAILEYNETAKIKLTKSPHTFDKEKRFTEGEFTQIKSEAYHDVPLSVIIDLLPKIRLFDQHTHDFAKKIQEIDGNEILGHNGKPIDIGRAANFVRAMQIMEMDMDVRKMGWKNVALLNVDSKSIERSGSFFQGITEGVSREETVGKMGHGIWDHNQIAAVEQIMNEVNINEIAKAKVEGTTPRRYRFTKGEEKNFTRHWFEEFGHGAGMMVPIVAEFGAVTAMTAGMGTAVIGARWLKPIVKWGVPAKRAVKGARFAKSSTFLTTEQLSAKVGASTLKIKSGDYAGKTIKSLYKTNPKAAIKAYKQMYNLAKVEGGIGRWVGWGAMRMAGEEGKIQLINTIFDEELPLGMGASFWAGGQAAGTIMKSWRFGPKSNFGGGPNAKYNLNPLLEKHVLGGIGFATASEVALPAEALVDNFIYDNKSWRRFVEETYPSTDFVLGRVGHNILLGNALGIQSHFGKGGLDFHLSNVSKNKFQVRQQMKMVEWNEKNWEATEKLEKAKAKGDTKGVEKYSDIIQNNLQKIKKAQELWAMAEAQKRFNNRAIEYMSKAERKNALREQEKLYNNEHKKKHGHAAYKLKIVDPIPDKYKKKNGKFVLDESGNKILEKKGNRKGIDPKNIHQINERYITGKNGKKIYQPEIIIDINKVKAGEMAHEIFHAMSEKYFMENKHSAEAFRAQVQHFVEKRYNDYYGLEGKDKKTYSQLVKQMYADQGKGVVSKEWTTGLVEMLADPNLRGVFIQEGLLSDISTLLKGLRNKMFEGTKLGETLKDKVKKDFSLDLNAENMIKLLSRWANAVERGEYNPVLEKKVMDMFVDEPGKGPKGKRGKKFRYKDLKFEDDGKIKTPDGKVVSKMGKRELQHMQIELGEKVLEILKNKDKYTDWKELVGNITNKIEDIEKELNPEIAKLSPKFEIDPVTDKEFENTVQRIWENPAKDLNTKAFEIAVLYDPIRVGERGEYIAAKTAGGKTVANELLKWEIYVKQRGISGDLENVAKDVVYGIETKGRGIRDMVMKYRPKENIRFTLKNGKTVDARVGHDLRTNERKERKIFVDKIEINIDKAFDWKNIRDYIKEHHGEIKSEKPVPLSGHIGWLFSRRGISKQVYKLLPEEAGYKVLYEEQLDHRIDESDKVGSFELTNEIKRDIDTGEEIEVGEKIDLIGKLKLPTESVMEMANAIDPKGVIIEGKLIPNSEIRYSTWKDVLPSVFVKAMGGKGWKIKTKPDGSRVTKEENPQEVSQAAIKAKRVAENVVDMFNAGVPEINVITSGKWAGTPTGAKKIMEWAFKLRIDPETGKVERVTSTLSEKTKTTQNPVQDRLKLSETEILKELGMSIDFKGNLNLDLLFEVNEKGQSTKRARKLQLRVDNFIKTVSGPVMLQVVEYARRPKSEDGLGISKPELEVGERIENLENQFSNGKASVLAARGVVEAVQKQFGLSSLDMSLEVLEAFAMGKLINQDHKKFLGKYNSNNILKSLTFKSLILEIKRIRVLEGREKLEIKNFNDALKQVDKNILRESFERLTIEHLDSKIKFEDIDVDKILEESNFENFNSVKTIDGKEYKFLDEVAIEKSNWLKHQAEIAQYYPSIKNLNKGMLLSLLGNSYRGTGAGNWNLFSLKEYNASGKLKKIPKSSKLLNPWKIIEKNLDKKADAFKDITKEEYKGYKSETVHAKAYERAYDLNVEGKDAEAMEVLDKAFTELDKKVKKKLYLATGDAQAQYLLDSKNAEQYTERAIFLGRLARNNTSLVKGERALVDIAALRIAKGDIARNIKHPLVQDYIQKHKNDVYTTPKAAAKAGKKVGERLTKKDLHKNALKKVVVKLEHAMPSLNQSIKKWTSVISGKWGTEGNKLTKKYTGVYSLLGHLDIIDARGGKTNVAALDRFTVVMSELKKHVTIESGFKETLEDLLFKEGAKELEVKVAELKESYLKDQVNDFFHNPTDATYSQLQSALKNKKQHKEVYNNTVKVAEKSGVYGARGLSRRRLLNQIDTTDKARAEGRKVDKERRGMSAWDFDDTLARTKSGVRYTLPNPSGKPQSNRKVIFMAGGPGAGKSNVIKRLDLKNQGFKIVNQDISLQWLAKNHGLPTDMRDFTKEQASKWSSLGWDARMIAKHKQSKFQGKGDGIIVDGTGASLNAMKKQVQEFRDKGYDVQMMFVETSKDVAIERNRIRKERSLRTGIVEKTWDSVMKNKESFKELFGERFAEINTDKLKQNDPMPKDIVSKMDNFTKGYTKGRLDPGEYANRGVELKEQGAEFDFSEFDVVVKGEKGPFFQKALDRAKKFGLKDQFIITARPHAAKMPIYEFLKAQGLNIPLKNIITLENSSAEAKARWMVEKFSEGYNDMYFADDALQNVKAVKDVLNQLDVKSKVQQVKSLAKRDLNHKFNSIIEETTDFKAGYEVGAPKARILGKDKRSQSLILPGAQDFMGLMYNFMGKGKQGETHKKFFEDNLSKPFARGWNDMLTHRQAILDDFKRLKDATPEINGGLAKTGNKYRHGFSDIAGLKTPSTWKNVPDSKYSYEQAVRVYLWNKGGFEASGLSKRDAKLLNETVMNDPILKNYADQLGVLSKEGKGYIEPSEYWINETIMSDVYKLTQERGMKKYLAEFIENKNIIFSKANMQKIEATQGRPFREALEDVLYRMERGTNRPSGSSRETAMFMNWINGSVGATMNWNMRSAVIQQLSTINFMNWTDNHPLMAAKAFANQPQFWKDYSTIWNSPVMRQRRKGLKINIHESEIADAVSTGGVRGAFNYFLKLGFTPTMLADSHAISFGGATLYRNRINTYLKKGLSKAEAEAQAFKDFQERSEPTQQSSRPDLISKWQADPILGRLIFPFSNVNTQNLRNADKGVRDAKNNRGDMKNNLSKVGNYGLLQPLLYGGLSAGLIALYLDEDEDFTEKEKQDKVWRTANTMLDSQLRGLGYPGAIISAGKNTMLEYHKQEQKPKWQRDHTYTMLQMTSVSPVVNIKLRDIYGSLQTTKFNEKVIEAMPYWDLDNPHWMAKAQMIQGTTNIPTKRFMYKRMNMKEAIDADNQWWQRAHHTGGWAPWDLGTEIEEIEKYKELTKKSKKQSRKGRGSSSRKGTR